MEEETNQNLPASTPPVARVLKDPSGNVLLEWDAWEREGEEKSSDWYWIVGAIALAAIVLAIFFKNFLFALIIGLAVFSLFMNERRGIQQVRVKLTSKGLLINSDLYLYDSIKSFWIDEDFEPDHLIIHSSRAFFPHIEISLDSVNTPLVRSVLSRYIPEEKESRSFIENIAHLLGF